MAQRHFGISLKSDLADLRLSRENYICTTKYGSYIFKDKLLKNDPSAWEAHRIRCLKNFDQNMEFYSSLDVSEFHSVLEGLISQFALRPVSDLREFDGVAGIYILVLSSYSQMYIGQADNMKKRIQQHWNRKMPFDRLIFGDDSSGLSVDSFRALDTTDIYVHPSSGVCMRDTLESEMIDIVPDKFLLNRTVGGVPKGPFGASGLIRGVKRRFAR